ncbi:hypothetical protein FrEUN1fDRAFT_3454 [Parafrankia sp. EUN1f]|nr:hypothetical protein FrEUN1fDRAFT_3454 [Parafrankia sp. EUN1f]
MIAVPAIPGPGAATHEARHQTEATGDDPGTPGDLDTFTEGADDEFDQ